MFLNDVGGSYRLKFTQEESDSFHAFFAGGVDSMTQAGKDFREAMRDAKRWELRRF